MMDRATLARAAIAKFGVENQTRKAVEELTELSLALQRALDGRDDNDNIREEIADVEIMLEQLRVMYDAKMPELVSSVDDWKKKKISRLEKIVKS